MSKSEATFILHFWFISRGLSGAKQPSYCKKQIHHLLCPMDEAAAFDFLLKETRGPMRLHAMEGLECYRVT